MPADKKESLRKLLLTGFRQIDDLGNIRQVVARESDHVGTPVIQSLKVVPVGGCLQIEQLDIVTGMACGCRN